MSALVIAEHNNALLHPATLATIAAAHQLAVPVQVLVIGYQCEQVAQEVSRYEGINEVILINDEVYQHQLAENTAPIIVEFADKATHILAPSTTFGKNLLPRVAGLLEVGLVSDIIHVFNQETFLRPIYAGNALAKVKSLDNVKLITVRTTAFSPVEAGTQQAAIRKEQKKVKNNQTTFVATELTRSERPDLSTAKIIIAGGRGLQSAENFKLLEQIATQLNAAIGASRAAVDAGFVPNDYQIGQTGKIVAPDLYLAIGISGAIQHIAGMKESKVIVAINKDPEAPIFNVADYGLVGDLFKLLPELQHALSELGYKLN